MSWLEGVASGVLHVHGDFSTRGEINDAAPISRQYESHPEWGNQRSFESAETNRLNRAHWLNAKDEDVNSWLMQQLHILRARATYESRNSGILCGVANTLVDDVVGPDGPMYECQSDSLSYTRAMEDTWREWFRSPTFRSNVSGATWLKLCVRNLPRCGEYINIIGTDDNASGPVKMRLQPIHARRLATPFDQIANPRIMMGVEFNRFDQPTRYWITESDDGVTNYVPYSPDDIIHDFILDEEGQARGFPWFTPSLQSCADLRDFDSDVLHSSRRAANSNGMLYTEHPDVPVWTAPESTRTEPGEIEMAPPGWRPLFAPPSQPSAQYPDFRAEKHRDAGRPFGMPLMMVRLDASKHNYSSARFDSQGYYRTVEGFQNWISGTPESTGTLSRLADLVAKEARFSVPALRNRPRNVVHQWTWPARPHVDPSKEGDAEAVGLETGTVDMITALAARGTTLERHLKSVQRVIAAYKAAGVPLPVSIAGVPVASTPEARQSRANVRATEEVASAK